MVGHARVLFNRCSSCSNLPQEESHFHSWMAKRQLRSTQWFFQELVPLGPKEAFFNRTNLHLSEKPLLSFGLSVEEIKLEDVDFESIQAGLGPQLVPPSRALLCRFFFRLGGFPLK